METDYEALYKALLAKEIERWTSMKARISRFTTSNLAHHGGAAQGIASGWAELLKRDLDRTESATAE